MVRFHLPLRGHPPVWTCGNVKEEAKCPPYVIFEEYIDKIVRDAYDKLDEDELLQLAAKRGEKGEAAKAALEQKRKHPRLKSIEYVFLDALVEQIAFNKWSEAVITWKFGKKSRVAVEYDKASEIPNVELTYTKEGFTANSERIKCGDQVRRRLNKTKACCEKARIKNEHGRPDGTQKAKRQIPSTAS